MLNFSHTTQLGLTAAQFYATADYQAKDLSGINFNGMNLSNNDLSGWNFAGFSLYSVNFSSSASLELTYLGHKWQVPTSRTRRSLVSLPRSST